MKSKYSNKEFNIWAFGREEAWKLPHLSFKYWMKYHSHLYKPNGKHIPIDDVIIMYEIWKKKKN